MPNVTPISSNTMTGVMFCAFAPHSGHRMSFNNGVDLGDWIAKEEQKVIVISYDVTGWRPSEWAAAAADWIINQAALWRGLGVIPTDAAG